VSNTATRILVALVAIPAIVALAWLGGYAWMLFVAAVYVGSAVEFAALARAKGARVQMATAVVFGLAFMTVFANERLHRDLGMLTGGVLPMPLVWHAFIWIALVFVLTTLVVELFRNNGSALLNVAATFMLVLYLGLCLGAAVGVREIFTVAEFPVGPVFGTTTLSPAQFAQLDAWGGGMVVALLAAIWMCDSAAYFGGRAMGRHALFARVSPKKTWEGAVWGLVGAIATMLAARAIGLPFLSVTDAVVLGAAVGTIGQIGDLAESLLKRDAGIKDSSTLLPGHGGVFDRFDSFIFVSPVFFLYLDFFVFA
jgi:phosphatidate cytidylyltransferase